MGVFKDIVDFLKADDMLDDVRANAMRKKYSSIAARASEGTMQFPIIVSDSMDIETLQMVVKALERNYSTFLQTAITMNATAETGKVANATQYLQQFHQNMDPNGTTRDISFDIVKAFENYNMAKVGKYTVLSSVYEGATRGCADDNREQLVDLMEDVRYDILNNKFRPRNERLYKFKNKDTSARLNNVGLKPMFEQMTPVSEAPYDDMTPEEQRFMRFAALRKEARENEKDARQAKLDLIKHQSDIAKLHSYELPSSILKDNDVKKANELIATTMHVRINWVNPQGVPQGTQDFIMGVKGTMHPVRSEEMVANVVGACKNNDKVFNFFRWTTGEIAFFRDFWLGIKDMKADIVNESKGASRWWIALKKRRTLGKMSDTAFFKNKILPNATLVVSAEEAEYIKVQHGYDLMNPYFVKKIMNTYYLLGFVVVDNSSQIVHFYFDTDSDYQSVSFSGLEKENSRDERKFKEMLKTLNRN